MESETEKQLHSIVLKTVEDFDAYEWLEETLGIETFTINSQGEFVGAEISICVGGPGVWVDTQNDVVEGRWGGDRRTMSFDTNEALDDVLKEHYEIVKGS